MAVASSTKASMAARATPSPTQQKPQPARSKPCMRFMGPVTRARRSIAENVRSSGTKRSSTTMSWLPVPRRPLTFQVSTMRTRRFRIEEGDPDVLIAIGPQPGRVAVEDLAGAVEQVRVHAAAGEEPVPAHAVAARHGHGAAPLAGRAGRQADGVAEEQLAADVGRQLRALAEGVDGHGQAPAGGAVGPRHLLDDLQGRQHVGAQAALGLRQGHLEQPRVGQLQDEVGRQLAGGLDLGGARADARRQRAGNLQGGGRGPRGVDGHVGSRPSCARGRSAVKPRAGPVAPVVSRLTSDPCRRSRRRRRTRHPAPHTPPACSSAACPSRN